MNKGFTVRLDEDKIKMFNRMYPGLLSKYMQACLDLAVTDKESFEKIFFTKTLMEI